MKNPRKSSFSSLAKYLLDDQGKQERVGDVVISNCHSLDPQWASLEVEATQALNTRATSDKTYHLLISFREGEDLSADVLKDIEQQMAKALGFEEHQRIAVVHRDTDNLHMHVAINKIHPTTHNLHEPYRDHRTRDELCIKIEEQYGLEKDNHKVRKTSSENKASDMENMSGLESLLSFVKKIKFNLDDKTTWQNLHESLAENGLEIKARGNGLIIQNDEGLAIKASSVSRDFSKGALERQLGGFQPSTSSIKNNATNKYESKPLDTSPEAQDLYQQYLNQRETFNNIRNDLLATLNKKHKSEIASLKRIAKLKRQTLKLTKGGLLKRIALKHISTQLQNDIQKLNKDFTKTKNSTYKSYRHLQWQDWLKRKAAEGNLEALKSLRKRKRKKYLLGNTISTNKTVSPVSAPVNGAKISYVTTKGNIVYKIANTEIRDDGKNFKVSTNSTNNGKEAAIRMAVHRFGSHLKISGNAKFKTAIARLVVSKNINVTFDDAALEKFKTKLLNNPHSKESYNEQREQSKRRRPSVRRYNESTRSTGARVTNTRVEQRSRAEQQPPRNRIDPSRAYDNWRLRKSNFGKLGKIPPPQSKDNLRGMSELGVVHIESRSEVLLSSNVSSNLVKQGKESNRNMRRGISRAGRISNVPEHNLPPQITKANNGTHIVGEKVKKNLQYDVNISAKPIDKYVKERNTKSGLIADISKHKVFDIGDAGNYVYKGYRNVDDQLLVLLDKTGVTVVIEADKKLVNRLKQAKVGSKVSLTQDGKITLLGRKKTQ